MSPLTVVLFSAGPAWIKGRTSREQPYWDGHAALIDNLTERGLLVAGGPFLDESGGMNILSRAPAELDVKALYATDPFLVNGIFAFRFPAAVFRPVFTVDQRLVGRRKARRVWLSNAWQSVGANHRDGRGRRSNREGRLPMAAQRYGRRQWA